MSNDQIIVPDADRAYLEKHHKTQTVPAMAKHLKRAAATVYKYMTALKLEPKPREIGSDHPFRKSNRRLETTLLHFRIENGKRQRGEN